MNQPIHLAALALAILLTACFAKTETASAPQESSTQESSAQSTENTLPKDLQKQSEASQKSFPNRLWRVTFEKMGKNVVYDAEKTPQERKYRYVHNDEFFCDAMSEQDANGKWVVTDSACKYYSDSESYRGIMGLIQVSGNKARYFVEKAMDYNYQLADEEQSPSIDAIIQYAKENDQFIENSQ